MSSAITCSQKIFLGATKPLICAAYTSNYYCKEQNNKKMIKFRLCTIITVAGVIDNELVFKFQLAEKSTWRNGKSLHLSKTNCTQVKDQSTASESFLFGSEST